MVARRSPSRQKWRAESTSRSGGPGMPVGERLDERADVLAFLELAQRDR
jgi:hypothetical protein